MKELATSQLKSKKMNGFPFQVEVVRTDRKRSVSISLSENLVKVIAPLTLSDNRIRDLVSKRSPFIQQKLQEISDRPKHAQKEFVSGESVTLLGKNYRLKVLKGESANIRMQQGYIEVTVLEDDSDPKTSIRLLLTDWYKSHAEKRLIEKTKRFSDVIGVKPNSVRVKDYCLIDSHISVCNNSPII
jgi:predicted metal-dependent hydrolase